MPLVRYISVNEIGRRIGASHPKARLSDDEVDRLRDMHERLNLTATEIAQATGIPRTTVQNIIKYQRRAQSTSRIIRYVETPKTKA